MVILAVSNMRVNIQYRRKTEPVYVTEGVLTCLHQVMLIIVYLNKKLVYHINNIHTLSNAVYESENNLQFHLSKCLV